jgi:hypothetical protein
MYFAKKNKHFIPNPNINLEIDGAIVKIFPVETRAEISEKLRVREGDGK